MLTHKRTNHSRTRELNIYTQVREIENYPPHKKQQQSTAHIEHKQNMHILFHTQSDDASKDLRPISRHFVDKIQRQRWAHSAIDRYFLRLFYLFCYSKKPIPHVINIFLCSFLFWCAPPSLIFLLSQCVCDTHFFMRTFFVFIMTFKYCQYFQTINFFFPVMIPQFSEWMTTDERKKRNIWVRKKDYSNTS